jgi:hypothetical protein
MNGSQSSLRSSSGSAGNKTKKKTRRFNCCRAGQIDGIAMHRLKMIEARRTP